MRAGDTEENPGSAVGSQLSAGQHGPSGRSNRRPLQIIRNGNAGQCPHSSGPAEQEQPAVHASQAPSSTAGHAKPQVRNELAMLQAESMFPSVGCLHACSYQHLRSAQYMIVAIVGASLQAALQRVLYRANA